MKKKTIKNFVVGYQGAEQTALYSKEAWANNDKSGGICKMTFLQAKKHLTQLYSDETTKVIFKLVPFKVFKPKK